jgi:hypothetical protein
MIRIRITFAQREELRGLARERDLSSWISLVERDFKGRVCLEGYDIGYEIEFDTEQAALMFRLKY